MSNNKKDHTMFILYVKNQKESKNFYEGILGYAPVLHVAGMTEFKISESVSLGIMPEEGISKILGKNVPNPGKGNGIPRCEIYLFVDNPDESYNKLIEAGGKEVSSPELRPWGDYVSYGADLDGHIIAFAKKTE